MERPEKALEYLDIMHKEAFRSKGVYEGIMKKHGFTKTEALSCQMYLRACCDDKFKEIVNGIDTKAD